MGSLRPCHSFIRSLSQSRTPATRVSVCPLQPGPRAVAPHVCVCLCHGPETFGADAGSDRHPIITAERAPAPPTTAADGARVGGLPVQPPLSLCFSGSGREEEGSLQCRDHDFLRVCSTGHWSTATSWSRHQGACLLSSPAAPRETTVWIFAVRILVMPPRVQLLLAALQ